jgi:hypothetical protein
MLSPVVEVGEELKERGPFGIGMPTGSDEKVFGVEERRV